MYGIDKTELRNIKVEAVDLNVLKYNAKAVYSLSDIGYFTKEYKTNESIQLDRIYIQDNFLFNSFRLDYKKNKGTKIYYTTLDITINSKERSQSNLHPLSVSEYINKLQNIKDYLAQVYGVYIDLKESRFHEIEINITDKMEFEFEEYKLLFEAIRLKRNKKTYPSHNTYEKRLEYGTHTFYSKVMELKFYNKTKQLYDVFKIQVDNKYMRLEYTLKGYDKINEKLGTTNPYEFTMDTLKDFLNESIKIDVFKPINDYIVESNKKLIKMYRNVKKQNKRGFIREFSHQANGRNTMIFDVEQILNIVKEDANKSGNYSKYKKTVYSIIANDLKDNFKKLKEFEKKFFIR